MSKVKRIGYVALVIVGVIFAYIIMLANMDFIRDASDIATQAADNSSFSESYTVSRAATASAPYWFLFLPAAAGGIAIVVILKQ